MAENIVFFCHCPGQVVRGGNNLADGPVDNATLQKAMKLVAEGGFLHEPQAAPAEEGPPLKLPRHRYAAMYGPTVGDRVQLGNTALILEVQFLSSLSIELQYNSDSRGIRAWRLLTYSSCV